MLFKSLQAHRIEIGKINTSFFNFLNLRLTLCTTSFNIQKFCVLPTMRLFVMRGFHNRQSLFLYTALNFGFYNRRRKCLLRGTN